MSIFLGLAAAVILGIAFGVKLLMQEGKVDDSRAEEIDPEDINKNSLNDLSMGHETALKPRGKLNYGISSNRPTQKLSANIISRIIGTNINKGKTVKSTNTDDPSVPLQKEDAPPTLNIPEATSGTASLKTSSPLRLSQEDEIIIKKEIDLSLQLSELKEKQDRVEKLFKEKSSELEKAQYSLNIELANKKEFNKVKDILEKELSETKDRSRKIQVELSSTRTEADGYKRRIELLEEKIIKLEKETLSKEKQVDDLLKRLQTFASPATAATPPIKEKIDTAVTHTADVNLQPPPLAKPKIENSKNEDIARTNTSAENNASSTPADPKLIILQPKNSQAELSAQQPLTPSDIIKKSKPEFLTLQPDVLADTSESNKNQPDQPPQSD